VSTLSDTDCTQRDISFTLHLCQMRDDASRAMGLMDLMSTFLWHKSHRSVMMSAASGAGGDAKEAHADVTGPFASLWWCAVRPVIWVVIGGWITLN